MPKEESHPYDPLFGLQLPKYGWVPAPRYLMRRDRILKNLKETRPTGHLLEIGCGTGALLEDFYRAGYRCNAVEISDQARSIAKAVHANHPDVQIYAQLNEALANRYDVLVSCEVIEHIEDDQSALNLWASTLKQDGIAIISTPSNPAGFNALDVWAGHFRRYTRASLAAICREAGLEPIRFESYGYPVVEFTEKIRGWVCARQLRRQESIKDNGNEMQEATEKSGIDRGLESRLFPILNSVIGRLLYKGTLKLQFPFLQHEIGNGLLCIAVKK